MTYNNENQFNPHDLANRHLEHGNDRSDKRAAADVLEAAVKRLKAQLALKYIKDAGSVAKAELYALADDTYAQMMDQAIEARRLANRADVLFDTDKVYIDMKRSEESTRRAEMSIR